MRKPWEIAISDYTYELPLERIAKFPLEKRDDSKLLIYGGTISSKHFRNLPEVLPTDSVLVLNNTKVINARLQFKNKNGGDIELFCLEPIGQNQMEGLLQKGKATWRTMVGGLKKWKEETLILNAEQDNYKVKITARKLQTNGNLIDIEFEWNPDNLDFQTILAIAGKTPLPPYMKRESTVADEARYQTTYHKAAGSVAAPTAGLHFTPQLLAKLKEKEIPQIELTLHVGAGTFAPVKAETMADHDMHAEWIDVSVESIQQLISNANRKTVAVGTTSVRTLESLFWIGVKLLVDPSFSPEGIFPSQWDAYNLPQHFSKQDALSALLNFLAKNKRSNLICQTQILIAPGYNFKMVDALITNFHQPNSTLLLLISAFVGEDWRKIYNYALENDYRFLSYGDSSILYR